MKIKLVLHTVGKVLLLEAILMLLPLIVAVIYGEGDIAAFAISIAITAAAGLIFNLAFKTDGKALYTRDGLAIAALSWIGISVFGALPFIISGSIPSPADAFFETVSGFTTTGASILTDVEALPHGLLFWRSFTHWIGGMGVLVFIMAVMDKAPDRSVNILRAEMPGHSVDIYLALTVIEIILLICSGMPLFDSIVHALGTAGTGGFGIKADSIASYSAASQWIISVFMLLFGVSFNIYYLIIAKRGREIFKSNELRTYLGISVAAMLIIALNIYPIYKSAADAIRLSAFQVSSIVTTTGYATADFDRWPELSKSILVILMFFGGCMGSTAGGLKMSRVTVLMQVIRNDLRHALRPREVSSVILNGRRLDAQGEKQVLSYFAVYMAVIGAAFLLISFEPFGFETNFTAAVSCVNNIGPGLARVGPSLSYAGYSVFSKLILSFAMLLGRLEIYPLLLLLSPQIWTKR